MVDKGKIHGKEVITVLGTQNYELMFIVNPELGEEETDALLKRVRDYTEEAGGQIFNTESWGLRRLAYSIQRHREGRYYLMRFSMESRNVVKFERNLLLAEGILRELLTRYEGEVPKETPPPEVSPAPEPIEPAEEVTEEEEAD